MIRALEQVAHNHGIPVEEVIEDIDAFICDAMRNSDYGNWNRISPTGEPPTPIDLVQNIADML